MKYIEKLDLFGSLSTKPTLLQPTYSILFSTGDEDSEEEALYTDAYEGMKLRSKSWHGSGEENGSIPQKNDEEDPLKWIEEDIPESENPLPVIDSDEEIETTKLEIKKCFCFHSHLVRIDTHPNFTLLSIYKHNCLGCQKKKLFLTKTVIHYYCTE